MKKKQRPMIQMMVFLADDEWGNETMDRIARETAANLPEVDAIEVLEHGGWYITYGNLHDGGELATLGTASQPVCMNERASAWRRMILQECNANEPELFVVRRQPPVVEDPQTFGTDYTHAHA